jgi:Uri superfamily endonuclease
MLIKGTYCLCIQIDEKINVKVGALNNIEFQQGKYIYVGSALNSLIPRVKRHIKSSLGEHPVKHWHIDYLLHNPFVSIKSIYYRKTSRKTECEIAKGLMNMGEPIKKIGCSDCNCVSHLFKVNEFTILKEIGMIKMESAKLFP